MGSLDWQKDKTLTINAEQIRAARALLDWSTADLARQADLTVNGINKIERGHVQPHRESLERIQGIFEGAGIEFLPNSGLRKKDRIIQTYEGEGANQQLLDDVYNTLKDIGGEVLITNVNEAHAIQSLSADYLSLHLERLKTAKISERMLIQLGDSKIVAALDHYRAIPPQYFVSTPMFIYGSKLALLSWQPSPRTVIIHDERFAESARKLFNFVWDKAEIISEKTRAHS